MEDSQGRQADVGCCDSFSLLHEALRGLKSASALISLLINDELAGSKDRDNLEGLYSVKGAVTCAIEETQERLQLLKPALLS